MSKKSKLLIMSILMLVFTACTAQIRVILQPNNDNGCTVTIRMRFNDNDGYESDEPSRMILGNFVDLPDYFGTSSVYNRLTNTLIRYYIDGEANISAMALYRGGRFFLITANRRVHGDNNLWSNLNSLIVDDLKPMPKPLWLPQYRIPTDGAELTCENTGEVVDLTNLEDAPFPQVYCIALPIPDSITTTSLYVGPGENRSVLKFIKDDTPLAVLSQVTDDDGQRWYEVIEVNGQDSGWVQFSTVIRQFEPPCTDIPDGTPPPIVQEIEAAVVEVDTTCDSFALISPSGTTIPTSDVTFSWTSLADADEYIVFLYSYSGRLVRSFYTPENSVMFNVGVLPTGSELSWDVYAMQDGELLCQTNRSGTLTKQSVEVPEIIETEEPDDDDKKKKKPAAEEPDDCDDYFDECDD